MSDHAFALAQVWRLALRPDPLLTVSEWSDRYRVLDRETPEPGRWRTSRTPYLREIMDRLSPGDPCERVVLQKGAQVGGTEAGNNWLGFNIHHAPGPMMVVQPTLGLAKRWSRRKLAKLVEATPELARRMDLQKKRTGDNTAFMKEFPGGFLIIAGANAAAGLRSSSIRYLFLDEVDAYPPDVDGEGDPVDLAEQRTSNFSNAKIFMVSTPTVKDLSRIELAFKEGDQRRYWVPCPSCEEYQTLDWAQVQWPPGRPHAAGYVCVHCGTVIENHEKTWMLERGEWRATAPGDGGRTVSYHLSSLYSPHGWLGWGEIATQFVKAQKDPVRLQVWVNTKLGETWNEDNAGETIDPDSLEARCEPYEGVPEAVAILTAGVDVQNDRVEVEVVGWGQDEESWSVDYRVIWGDPSVPQLWHELDEYLTRRWRHPVLGDQVVVATAVDTGGHHTQAAYDFCESRIKRRVFAIKGQSGAKLIWPQYASKVGKNKKVRLHMVGVDTAKRDVYNRLKIKEPGAGYCHFPEGRDPRWFQQLTAETLKVRYHRGHPTYYWYLPAGRRNEALDCRVYAYAALHGYYQQGLDLDRAVDRVRQAKQDGPGVRPRPKRVARRPADDWFNGRTDDYWR